MTPISLYAVIGNSIRLYKCCFSLSPFVFLTPEVRIYFVRLPGCGRNKYKLKIARLSTVSLYYFDIFNRLSCFTLERPVISVCRMKYEQTANQYYYNSCLCILKIHWNIKIQNKVRLLIMALVFPTVSFIKTAKRFYQFYRSN